MALHFAMDSYPMTHHQCVLVEDRVMHLMYVLALLLHGQDRNVMYQDVMVLQPISRQQFVVDEELVLLLMSAPLVLVVLVDLAVNYLFAMATYQITLQLYVQVVELV